MERLVLPAVAGRVKLNQTEKAKEEWMGARETGKEDLGHQVKFYQFL